MGEPTAVERVLRRARELRFLGPSPLADHIANGWAFVDALADVCPAGDSRTVADLGPGGGVPSLVIAEQRPDLALVLIERATRRADFLRWAVAELGWSDRVQVVVGEAEDVSRDGVFEGQLDVVTARSFGPAAVTAECGCRLLRLGGVMLVSEPPTTDERWEPSALKDLGLRMERTVVSRTAHVAVLERDASLTLDDRYPRRAGVPRRRPLF